MRAIHGADTIYLTTGGLTGEINGMLSFQRETQGVRFRSKISKRLRQAPGLGPLVTVYRWQHGPVVLDDADQAEVITGLLEAVEERAQREGILAIDGITLAGYADALDPGLADLMRERGYEATPAATFLVDLALPEDELMKASHRSVRKNLRRCAREGVQVERVMAAEGWREFALLRRANHRSLGLPVPFKRRTLLHNKLLNEGEKRFMELFMARHNGRAIAGLAVQAFNGRLTESMSVNSSYALGRRLPAQDLLRWEIMRWGKADGFHTFDLAGVAPSPQTDKEAGIKRFKAKFGGRYVEYGTYRKVFRPFAYRLLSRLKRWREP